MSVSRSANYQNLESQILGLGHYILLIKLYRSIIMDKFLFKERPFEMQ